MTNFLALYGPPTNISTRSRAATIIPGSTTLRLYSSPFCRLPSGGRAVLFHVQIIRHSHGTSFLPPTSECDILSIALHNSGKNGVRGNDVEPNVGVVVDGWRRGRRSVFTMCCLLHLPVVSSRHILVTRQGDERWEVRTPRQAQVTERIGRPQLFLLLLAR